MDTHSSPALQKIPIDSIVVEPRLRRSVGNIDDLAQSIEEIGLIAPIVINRDRKLIAGERRLSACRKLGFSEIDVIVKETSDIENELLLEIAENIHRENFTREEAIAAGIELERIEAALSEERRLCNLKQNNTEVENLPPREPGKTRDIVAKRLGLSGKQYEREKFIIRNKDLLSDGEFADWNTRAVSTNKIYNLIKDELSSRNTPAKSRERNSTTDNEHAVLQNDDPIINDLRGKLEAAEKMNDDLKNTLDVAAKKNAELADEIVSLKNDNHRIRFMMDDTERMVDTPGKILGAISRTQTVVNDQILPLLHDNTLYDVDEIMRGKIETFCDGIIQIMNDLRQQLYTQDFTGAIIDIEECNSQSSPI